MNIDWTKSKEIIGEDAQLAAVQQSGYALQYCHQPSEAVMLAAVQQNGYALQYCHQPSEAVMLAAVQQDGYALQYCHQPSEAVMLAAVQQDGDALRYCHQPSEAVMLAAVQQDGDALRFFKRGWFVCEESDDMRFSKNHVKILELLEQCAHILVDVDRLRKENIALTSKASNV